MSLRFRFGIEGGRKTKDAADHTDTNCIPATDDFAVKFSQAGQRIIHDRDPTGSGFVKSHFTGSVTHQVEPPCRISSGAGHPSHSRVTRRSVRTFLTASRAREARRAVIIYAIGCTRGRHTAELARQRASCMRVSQSFRTDNATTRARRASRSSSGPAYWPSRSQDQRFSPDVVVVVRADLSEIVSRPAVDVLGDPEVTVREEPLGDGGVPEGEVHVRPGLPCLGTLRQEVHEPLSPAGPVEGLGLRLKFCWPGAEPKVLGLLLKGEPLR